jgi:2-polyprenyl-3-methyl-5-hydroxy-6-metoxy-1,4-benzoquinol methylase
VEAVKYYDRQQQRPIDPERDCCQLGDWQKLRGNVPCAWHPKGFPIFLNPDELEKCDEYKDTDPYTVEVHLNSDFHQRRLQCTVSLLAEALQQVQGVPKLLDVGCGQGHITARIKEAFPQVQIAAFDYSVAAVEYGVDHFAGLNFAVANAYNPPYPDNYFDLVICNNLWEHVPDPLHLLSGLQKIMKDHGFLVISTPSRYRLRNLVRVIQGKPVALMSEHHVTEYSVGQVMEQLQYGGFKVVKVLSKHTGDGFLKSLITRTVSSFLSIIGSHHQLEATVFYLAQRV